MPSHSSIVYYDEKEDLCCLSPLLSTVVRCHSMHHQLLNKHLKEIVSEVAKIAIIGGNFEGSTTHIFFMVILRSICFILQC